MTPERLARLREVLDRRQPDLTVITDFVHKPRNTSAIVRICDAVGIMALHAVVGESEYRAFRGTAMGSHNWVAVHHHATLPDAVARVRAETSPAAGQIVAAHPAAAARDYRDLDYSLPTALLLGTERAGLGESALALADVCIAVPMVGMVESHNVAVAAGIILAEAQRQRHQAGLYEQRRLDDTTWQRLFFEWAHPGVRDFCRQRGLDYPALDDEGEIIDGPAWYAQVRDSLGGGPPGEGD